MNHEKVETPEAFGSLYRKVRLAHRVDPRRKRGAASTTAGPVAM